MRRTMHAFSCLVAQRSNNEATVRSRVRVGVPVHVHYSGEGDNMLVDRVTMDED